MPSYQPERNGTLTVKDMQSIAWVILTMLLHAVEEFNDDLRAWTDEHLALSRLLGVVDGVERVVEDACFDHIGRREILSSMVGGEVSAGEERDPC